MLNSGWMGEREERVTIPISLLFCDEEHQVVTAPGKAMCMSGVHSTIVAIMLC